MIFITGGRYQGKLDYAVKRFGLAESDICHIGLDFSRRCLADLDRYALDCVKNGVDPLKAFQENPSAWQNSILISADISGGVVPIDPVLRAWREASGRMNLYLAAHADEVWRLFCGIPQRLK